MEFLAAILTPDVVGLLDRHVTVGLVEVSRGGCLLESTSPLPAGAVAVLTVTIEGTTYRDYVRVARCARLAGAGDRHHVGLEFLPLERPAAQSLRRYAAAVDAETVRFSGMVPLCINAQ